MNLLPSTTIFILAGWWLAACQPTKTELPPEPSPPIQGTPTERGKPLGSPVQKIIGPAGGILTTLDERLTLFIPAGALPDETSITLQPVENKAWGGTGLGYELYPLNLGLAKPASLIWHYQDTDLVGSVPEALGIARQQADHSWKGQRNLSLDKTGRKITTPIDTFQTVAFYEQYFLKPAQARVAPAETIQLDAYGQAGHEDDPTAPFPLVQPTRLKATEVTNWLVNGQDVLDIQHPQLGGMSLLDKSASAIYLAPTRIPGQNQLAVSVEVLLTTKAKLFLITNLVIEGANVFKLGAVQVDSAEVGTIGLVDGQFFQISLSERPLTHANQAFVTLSMLPFVGTGQYEITGTGQVRISAVDRNRKNWSDSYTPRIGKKIIGPLTVHITEYDRDKKRVAGHFSGTLHHYDDRTDTHESTTLSAHFRAASPY